MLNAQFYAKEGEAFLDSIVMGDEMGKHMLAYYLHLNPNNSYYRGHYSTEILALQKKRKFKVTQTA